MKRAFLLGAVLAGSSTTAAQASAANGPTPDPLSPPSAVQTPVTKSLTYDSLGPVQQGSQVAFAVREASHDGGTDLNGDLDTTDEVLFLHDAQSGLTTNLGSATRGPIAQDGGLVAFRVDEAQDGGTDHNLDGDAQDAVLFVHDAASGVTWNVGRALPTFDELDFVVQAPYVAFLVAEAGTSAEGVDLNGDGDVVGSDQVVFLWDATTGVATNLGIAASEPPHLANGHVVFPAFEIAQGAADFNGDLDVVDGVVCRYDIATGQSSSTGLAGSVCSSDGGLVLIVVDELAQGSSDLNGDGDAFDKIVHAFDPQSGAVTPLDLTVPSTNPECSGSGAFAAFLFDESAGSQDRNGDGDQTDRVVTLVRKADGALISTGLAMAGAAKAPSFVGGTLAIPVPEAGQGQGDLNGDGDQNDLVLFAHAVPTGKTVNTGLALLANGEIVADKALIVFGVPESEQQVDLNGDGDQQDVVTHVHYTGLGTTHNTGLAISPAGGRLAAGDGLVLILVHEASQAGASLNGDPDTQDDVAHLLQARGAVVTNLGLAALPGPISVAERLAVFSVPELGQGAATLNADADAVDAIVHLAGPWL